MEQADLDKQYFEQLLGLTSTPEWGEFVKELEREIYQNQATILENSQHWDQVVFAKGWNKCLAYIINTRERAKVELQNIEESKNADV